MSSFGENLRREREMRGVTLEEISAATKISVRFLRSVEKEEFSELPGGIFVRSFIRSYARYLGLDDDALLAEYQLITKDKGDADLTRLTSSRPLPLRPKRSPWRFLGVSLAAVVLLVAGFAIWRYSRRRIEAKFSAMGSAAERLGSQSAASKSLGQTAAPANAPKPGPSQSGLAASSGQANGSAVARGLAASKAENPALPPAPATPAGSPQETGGLLLQIAATERSWVAVDADGKTVLQGVLTPNEVRTVHAKGAFDVLTGNAQGVILTLNGQTLKPLGREGEVKSIHLTRDDVKNAGN